MPADITRAAYYQRQARESQRIASNAAKRGDAKGARAWQRIAQGELEAASYWLQPDAPQAPALAFMLEGVQ